MRTAWEGGGKARKRKQTASRASPASDALAWKETCAHLMAVVKQKKHVWNQAELTAIHTAFDAHYDDENVKSVVEGTARKPEQTGAIFGDIDALLQ
jgi:hypothetical protein